MPYSGLLANYRDSVCCRAPILLRLWTGILALVGGGMSAARAEENTALSAALATITIDDLRKHVDVLANDTFEGREAGSRGGHAAATYVGRELKRHRLPGGAADGAYYQGFG